MKKYITRFLIPVLLSGCFHAFGTEKLWHKTETSAAAERTSQLQHPKKYLVYTLEEAPLKLQLFSASTEPTEATIITLPMADGTFRDFRVWQSSLLPPALAAKYPDIKTFTGEATDNRNVTLKAEFTVYGFHAMILDGVNASFVDPINNFHDGTYMVHYKSDETRPAAAAVRCTTDGKLNKYVPTNEGAITVEKKLTSAQQRIANGWHHKTYRLALGCDHQYAQTVTQATNPSKAEVFSKMTTTMNRVNGVYERELSVTMQFAVNEDTLIYTESAHDPYGVFDGDAPGMLSESQAIADSVIGDANYDIGHVFNTGGGGLSSVGVVCLTGLKAQSETGLSSPMGDGFDIDFVSHEMGHEFSAQHPFNDSQSGNCAGHSNAVSDCAYEPGSGSTIMAYAGICPPDDLQPHSDPYFHAINLIEISAYINDPATGNSCPVNTATNNKIVYLRPFTKAYNIPCFTPFELTAPVATDSVADTSTTYCWEEFDLGDFGATFANTHDAGPIFRSYKPVNIPTRVFPRLSMILSDTLDNSGHEDNEGEKVPDVARTLNFKITVRDIYNGLGCFLIPDDSVVLNAVATGDTFKVINPPGFARWNGGTMQTVGWRVAGTNAAPISCDSVDITMSGDEGKTWQYALGRFPNNGSASILVPDMATDSFVRVKVKGHNNVFFSLNPANILVTHVDSAILLFGNGVKFYPNPTNNVIHVSYQFDEPINIVIDDAIGRKIYEGVMTKQLDIPVNLWPRGIYFARIYNSISNQRVVKKFLVE